ncbi:hypothetical protein [Lysinibacter cavernae]|uniref:Surface antigen domain-containing protein n=1 Tax=Lysinibacter cavernae TaxID=1640652 RepID=A0A7X5TST0_9MICO|nr:hypothetical protein [Lysinibacter cavernae]NIH52779.1 hypothetical protein [Lysinibacter cavernae]
MNRFKLAITAIVVGACALGGATAATAADYQSGSKGTVLLSNPNRAAYSQYLGTNSNAPVGLSWIKASDMKRDGYSALTVLQKREGGKWVEVSRVIASGGIGADMKRTVMRPKKGTQMRLTSCTINRSAPAAKRVGFNCQSEVFYAV